MMSAAPDGPSIVGYRSAAMHCAAGGPLPSARTIADPEAVACDPLIVTAVALPAAHRRAWAALRHDLPASLVVLLIAVPLSLGIAVASGAPVMAGLIAAAVGGIVAGLLGGSRLLRGGCCAVGLAAAAPSAAAHPGTAGGCGRRYGVRHDARARSREGSPARFVGRLVEPAGGTRWQLGRRAHRRAHCGADRQCGEPVVGGGGGQAERRRDH